MPKYILSLLFFIGSVAQACPDLTGTYTCVDENDAEATISQSEENDITTYTIERTDYGPASYVSDGQPHTIESSDDTYTYIDTTTTTCVGEEVHAKLGLILADKESGRKAYEINNEAVMYLDADKNFVTFVSRPNGTTDTYNCIRK